MATVDLAMNRARVFLREMSEHARGLAIKRAETAADPSMSPRPRRSSLEDQTLARTGGAVRKTIWGSPAGKKRLAPRLVKLIPVHKTYVEPFAGSGAVFFEKPPSDVEVLADADPEIADAYRTLTRLTDADLAALKKKDWTGRKATFEALKKASPRGKVDKLYRFLYLSHFAYGALRGKSYNAEDEGTQARTIARIEKHRDRLRRAKVRSGHYVDVVKEFDGKDTFFFLDPPYPGYNVQVGENRFDEVEFRKVLDHIQGKFLITYGARGKLDTDGFHVKKIRTPRTIASMRGVGGPKLLTQLLISNYAITQKSLGPYELDDVDGDLALSSAIATDLYHARVLAKALVEAAADPEQLSPLAALAAALDFIEPVEDDSAHALAQLLLPLTDRIAPTMHAAPAVAKALRDARPALGALARLEAGAQQRPQIQPPHAEEPAACIFGKRIPLFKTEEERYVLGIVLEPETVDAQNDVYSAVEVRDAAHRFLENFRNVGLMHQGHVNDKVKIIESYLSPTSFDLGGTQVKKGTWLLAVHVLDDELWGLIKSGELTGLSMGGSARRNPEEASETT
ncbi:MAG TPA: XkdF-like putative serine protease domain-containing protein [Kofleriaceae bacterium]|nr:XkdF-like putative serine protease domain-containing protein [Kofleriaceae bacterium]